MYIGKKRKYIIKKSTLKRVVLIGLAAGILLTAVIIVAENGFDPADYYPTVKVMNDPEDINPLNQTTEIVTRYTDGEKTALVGIDPFPGYIPDGYSLNSARFITGSNGFATGDDYMALALEYVNSDNSDKRFTVTVSKGERLLIETGNGAYGNLKDTAESYNKAFADFGCVQLYIGVISGTGLRFGSFEKGGREWLVSCENMSKRELRLIICSIVEKGE